MSASKSFLMPHLAAEYRPEMFLDVQEDVRELLRLEPGKYFKALLLNWGIILATCAAFIAYGNFWLLPLTMLIIGTRQHALAFFAHEGVHGNIVRNKKWNQRVAKWFAAWPSGFHYEVYRQVHLQHHFHTNEEQDPDWQFFKDWHQYPQNPAKLLGSLLPYLFGLGFIEVNRFQMHMQKAAPRAPKIDGHLILPALVVAMLGYAFFTQNWSYLGYFLGLWILPIYLVFYPLNLLRALTEHYGLDYPDADRSNRLLTTRSIAPTLLGRLLISPLSASRHLEHHLYDKIPFYNLEKLAVKLAAYPEFRRTIPEYAGFFGTQGALRHLTRIKAEPRKSGLVQDGLA